MPVYSPKQARAILSPPRRWNFLVGATRSGKTYINYDIIPLRARTLPPGNCYLIGKTLGTLTKNVIRPMQDRFGEQYISGMRGRLNECFVFGRRFYCVGANDESSLKHIQGSGMIYANCDEIALYPKTFVEMLKSRLSEPGAVADATLNPEGPKHFIKTDFLDRKDELDIQVIHFTLDDNPFLDPAFVSALKSEYKGVWYKRLILGLWVAAEGAIYDMFDDDIHIVDEVPKEVEILQYWACGDYGTTNPTVFLLVGLGSDGCYYVLDEYRYDSAEAGGRKKSPVEYAEDLYAFLGRQGIHITNLFMDPSAIEFIQTIKGRVPVKGANNEVVNGILRTASLFSTIKLKVLRRCKGLINEIYGYVWDAKASEKGQDAPVKVADHGPDALRYFVNEVAGKHTLIHQFQ